MARSDNSFVCLPCSQEFCITLEKRYLLCHESVFEGRESSRVTYVLTKLWIRLVIRWPLLHPEVIWWPLLHPDMTFELNWALKARNPTSTTVQWRTTLYVTLLVLALCFSASFNRSFSRCVGCYSKKMGSWAHFFLQDQGSMLHFKQR